MADDVWRQADAVAILMRRNFDFAKVVPLRPPRRIAIDERPRDQVHLHERPCNGVAPERLILGETLNQFVERVPLTVEYQVDELANGLERSVGFVAARLAAELHPRIRSDLLAVANEGREDRLER